MPERLKKPPMISVHAAGAECSMSSLNHDMALMPYHAAGGGMQVSHCDIPMQTWCYWLITSCASYMVCLILTCTQELFRVPQKDATVQLQNAAAIVNQWHAAYMEVLLRQVASSSRCQAGCCDSSQWAPHCLLS